MAEKQIVREDVISISFEVDNAAAKSVQEMVNNITGGAVREMQEMADKVSETADAFEDLKKPISETTEGISDAGKEASTFADKLKSAVNAGIEKLTHPIQTIKSALGSAKEAAGNFVTKIKDIGKQKLTSITSSVNELKSKLTEGKTGASGLVTALKNVGKMSVSGAVSGIKSVASTAKTAASKLTDMADTDMSKLTESLDGVKSKLSDIASSAAKTALKGVGIAVGAAAAGVTATVKSAVSEYADTEQLKGGVETLFKDSAQAVLDNANQAYKNVGLSANEYMDTVTSFSASLISSLGGDTAAAAEKADLALTDMADNANKMGTDMESIQNAYQGFAKQNYTMLDNLKLGYGGTKEEMERLLADAEAISGVTYDVSSYADIVDAIHVIQDNMGITGTTADEAEHTISGSLAMVKASWKDVLSAMVGGKDSIDTLENRIDYFVDSVTSFGNNLMPAIEGALKGVGSLIERLTPMIAEKIPDIVDTLLPSLLSAAVSLVQGLIKALPGIVQALINALPGVISQIGDAIAEAFGADSIIGKISSVFTGNADAIVKAIPYIAGFIAAIAALVKISSVVSSVSGALGKVSGKNGTGGISSFFEGLAKTKTSTILKGVANMAIIIAGITALAAGIMLIAPYLAKLSDAQSLIEVLAVIAAVGVIGAGLAELAGIVGNIPVSTVALGLANIAIIFAGITALASGLILITPYLSQMTDVNSILDLLKIITAVGLVGSALAVLAGLVGLIPVPAIVSGLAGIATAIGGFTAIVAAYAALASIPGFSEFMEKGGAALSQLAGILGDVIGSFVGGAFEGIASVLPSIGESLSGFAEAAAPFFEIAGSTNISGVGDFLKAFAEFALMMTANDILSIFTGGLNLTELGTELTSFALAALPFFTTVAMIKQEAFDNASALFQCLADISNVPKSGGLMQMFSGETDFDAIANGLAALASDDVIGFFTKVGGIPAEAFNNATLFFQSLSDIGNIPKSGGIAQWFGGDTDYEGLAEGLKTIAGGISEFAAAMGETTVSTFTTVIASLGELGTAIETFQAGTSALTNTDLPALSSAFTSLNTTVGEVKTSVGKEMSAMSDAVKKQCSLIKTQVTDTAKKIKSAFSSISLKSVGADIMTGLLNGLKSKETELLNYVKNLAKSVPETMNTNLDIGSPSKVMYEIGGFTAEGLINGISDSIPRAEDTSERLATAVTYGDTENVYTGGNTHTETNTYSPVFNLTISGASSDRDTERKIKKWIKECLNDIDASTERKSPITQAL